jgi:hypothetical protein
VFISLITALAPAISSPTPQIIEDEPEEQSLALALTWLAAHQDEDGRWDADGFMKHDPEEEKCDGPGHQVHDVGVTGLALLAFLAEGSAAIEGPHAETIERGVSWLVNQQAADAGSLAGLIGKNESHAFLYDHAIGTRALCEAYGLSKDPEWKEAAQRAVNFALGARNPYAAWRYDVPPIGDNDTSITGWMIFALVAGQNAGLEVDQDALTGALAWLDEVTDPATGRCGYDSFATLSSRTPVNDHYPRESGEAMTGIALSCRFALGHTMEQQPVMRKHADLLLRNLPLWEPKSFGCDMYYWYYGTLAMSRAEGNHWEAWQKALLEAVTGSQSQRDHEKGSWDPVGPWGYSGGRIYSTAMMTLCLQIERRMK